MRVNKKYYDIESNHFEKISRDQTEYVAKKMAIEKYDSENKHEFEDIPGVFDESSETEDIF